MTKDSPVAELITAINNLLQFLHERGETRWDEAFDRPLKELTTWGNHAAAILSLKQIGFGGMGGILDRDYGTDNAEMNRLCDAYAEALDDLENTTPNKSMDCTSQ